MAEAAEVLSPARLSDEVRIGAPTVRVENAHVRYQVYEDVARTMRDIVARRRRKRTGEVHALKGVSFTAHAGEVIGVIGRNGSGKSTLMRAVAGLQPLSRGAVFARSTPMLLGVGAVLNKSLSGRRNILLGCLALGLTRQEVEAREQDIIDFAGIGQAIDRPMRTYSSGMSARLQFAISSAVAPEILIIDEALAVGDRAFKRKSAQRIAELRDAAGTVFIVTHSMRTVRSQCGRVLWLEDGELRGDGDPHDIVRRYRGPVDPEKRRRRRQQQQQRRRQRQRRRQQELREQAGRAQGPPPDPRRVEERRELVQRQQQERRELLQRQQQERRELLQRLQQERREFAQRWQQPSTAEPDPGEQEQQAPVPRPQP